jgi:hypothetical protein
VVVAAGLTERVAGETAERFRLARTIDQDRALTTSRASAWAAADPELYAALEWIGAVEWPALR